MKNKKEITEKDMELIERKIDAINIKMINWKYEILCQTLIKFLSPVKLQKQY